MPLGPVFLSASIPDPRRDEKYFRTCETIAIRDAVIALVTVVVPQSTLVFGGHPAITPMVKWVADQLDAFDRVRMFQSRFFRNLYLKDVDLFHYIETDSVENDREKSLAAMRTQMILSEDFSAAFFIGGMEGVEREHELMEALKPGVPRFPVYTTGAASRLLWEQERDKVRPGREPALHNLRMKTNYTALFTDLLERLSERRSF